MSAMAVHTKTVRIDEKGRVSLGRLLHEGISGFKAFWDNKNRLILEPMVEIPVREKWLFETPGAVERITRAHKQMQKGTLHPYSPGAGE